MLIGRALGQAVRRGAIPCADQRQAVTSQSHSAPNNGEGAPPETKTAETGTAVYPRRVARRDHLSGCPHRLGQPPGARRGPRTAVQQVGASNHRASVGVLLSPRRPLLVFLPRLQTREGVEMPSCLQIPPHTPARGARPPNKLPPSQPTQKAAHHRHRRRGGAQDPGRSV